MTVVRRVFRGLMYTFLIAAGLLYVVWPSPSLASQLDWRTYVWSGFLTVGGSLSLYGTIRKRFLGEYVGIPLLVAAFLVFGVAIILAPGGAQSRVILGLVLLAFASGLQHRWQEVRVLNVTLRKKPR